MTALFFKEVFWVLNIPESIASLFVLYIIFQRNEEVKQQFHIFNKTECRSNLETVSNITISDNCYCFTGQISLQSVINRILSLSSASSFVNKIQV